MATKRPAIVRTTGSLDRAKRRLARPICRTRAASRAPFSVPFGRIGSSPREVFHDLAPLAALVGPPTRLEIEPLNGTGRHLLELH